MDYCKQLELNYLNDQTNSGASTSLENGIQKLKTSEEQFKTIFKLIPNPIFIYKKVEDDLILIDYNKAAEDITEGKIKNIIGVKAKEFHKEDPEILEDLNRCIKDKVKISRELKYRFKTIGKEKLLNIFYNFVPPDIVLIHTEDISEKRKIEEDLKKSEFEKSIILNGIPELIAFQDKEHNILWANKAAGDSVNESPEELIGSKCYEIWNIRKGPCENCPIHVSLISGKVELKEMTTPDGRIWEIRGYPIKDDNENIIGAIEVTKEITERKKVEQKLIESEEKFRTMADQSLIGIIIIQDGKVVYVNQAESNIMEYSTQEMMEWTQEDLFKHVHPDDRSEAIIRIRKSQEERDVPPIFTYRIRTKFGKTKIVDIYTKLIDLNEKPALLTYVLDVSDKKQAEQKLKESEERYRNIFEKSPNAIVILDFTGKIIECNSATETIFGYSKDKLIGQNYLQLPFYSESMIKVLKERFQEITKEVDLKPQELQIKRKDGNLARILTKISYIKIGEQNYFQALIQDITEQKNAEEKLKESEEKFSKAFQSSPDVMAITRMADGLLIEVNDAFINTLGYNRDELIGSTTLELNIWANPEQRDRILKEIRKYKRINAVEVPVNSKFGRQLTLLFSAEMINLNNENCLITMASDITKRKRAEEKLKESEEKFRLIAEQSLVGIAIIQDNSLKYVNKALANINGYSIEEMLKWKIDDFIKTIDPKFLKNILSDFDKLKRGQIKSLSGLEYAFYNKQNDVIWLNTNVNFITYEQKPAFLITTIDISDKKIVEKKLRESEEKYREAYNRSNLYKDIFTHDINNILQNILSSVGLSKLYSNDLSKKEELEEVTNIINEQIIRGKTLVSNVQKLSQVDEIKISKFSIEALNILKKSIEYIKENIHYKNINIEIESDHNEYYVIGNELLINIFENILFNSIKHNINPIIKILIRISKLTKDGANFIKFEFLDNGIGIPDSMKKTIFSREYNRIEKDKIPSGIGLGLLLVNRILDSYNGEIEVENKIQGDYSKGSNFIILIPEAV